MLIQWHLSDQCTRRCRHCYQGPSAAPSLPLPELLALVEQMRALGPQVHVTVTGGEPLLVPHLWDLLAGIRGNGLTFSLLTNGDLLDAVAAQRLAALGCAWVQVSLDGDLQQHERVRGPGSFAAVMAALACLRAARIPSLAAFTAHADNLEALPGAAAAARRGRASMFWADRLIPLTDGGPVALEVPQTRRFLELLQGEACAFHPFSATRIRLHRALQFLVAGGRPYRCQAGRNLFALMPDASLLPCRRLPMMLGNCWERPLSALVQAAQDRFALPPPPACRFCAHAGLCSGGLRCLTWARYGRLDLADPGCWRAGAVGGQSLER